MEHRTNPRAAPWSAPVLPRIGRYQLLNPLGRGAFGQVFECYDPVLDRRLAVKVLCGELPANLREEFLERFRIEVRVLARLSHPHVVLVHDAGLDGPFPYVVMELCSGPSLDLVLAGSPRLALEQAAWLTHQVARALDYVHSRGIVHRDVKPANLMFHHGTLKLTDFGLAHTALSHLTSAGQVLGTPAFMSPEQVRGEQIDHRSDLYSLGALFFHVLAGRAPFQGTPYAIMSQLVSSDPPRFSSLVSSLASGMVSGVTAGVAADVAAGVTGGVSAGVTGAVTAPPALDDFFARALAREPAERFASGAELCRALFEILPEDAMRPLEGLETMIAPDLAGMPMAARMALEAGEGTARYTSTGDMGEQGIVQERTLRIENQSSSWLWTAAPDGREREAGPRGQGGLGEAGWTRALPDVRIVEGDEEQDERRGRATVALAGRALSPPAWVGSDRALSPPAWVGGDRALSPPAWVGGDPASSPPAGGGGDQALVAESPTARPSVPAASGMALQRRGFLPTRRGEPVPVALPLSSMRRLRRRSPWVSAGLLAVLMVSAFVGWEWQDSRDRLELFSAGPEQAGAATAENSPAGATPEGDESDVLAEAVSATGRPSDASAKRRHHLAIKRKALLRY